MDTLKALNRLEKTIEAQRELQLQAHGVPTCLYEVLLHAECEEAVSYAQATYVARALINKSAEELDSVRITPLLDALAPAKKVEEPRVLSCDLREHESLALPRMRRACGAAERTVSSRSRSEAPAVSYGSSRPASLRP